MPHAIGHEKQVRRVDAQASLVETFEVQGQAPGSQQHRIDAPSIRRLHVARPEFAARAVHPRQPLGCDRRFGFIVVAARLYLDEDDGPAILRHEVDFAAPDALAARKDAVALQAQPERGERFGAAAAPLGFLPVQRLSAFKTSARS